jgi:hypothetical protein
MLSLIIIHADFEAHWPFVGERLYDCWRNQAETALLRLPRGDSRRLGEIVANPHTVTRLISLHVPVTLGCLEAFSSLREAAFLTMYSGTYLLAECAHFLRARSVKLYQHTSEGFWGQSVAEFALALTLCALRQIPQNYHAMLTSHEPWGRYQAARNQGPGAPGAQFSDDARFTHGTLAGKRVRIIGAGNIGSRYASFAHMLGAHTPLSRAFTAPAAAGSGISANW